MESHGALNQIHTTKSYRDSTKELFEYESRGVMAVKGKGDMETFFLKSVA